MNWEEQLQGITLGTLFKLGGKCMVASILWIIIFYVIIMGIFMVPMFFITNAFSPY